MAIFNNKEENSKGILFIKNFYEAPEQNTRVRVIAAMLKDSNERLRNTIEKLSQEIPPGTKPGNLLISLKEHQCQMETEIDKLAGTGIGPGCKESADPIANLSPDEWIVLALENYFREWKYDVAENYLWNLTREQMCAENESEVGQRQKAASFYEWTKILLDATFAINKLNLAKK